METSSFCTRVAMPTLKPCPHCGREVGDWHREWYARENQVELFNHSPCSAHLSEHLGFKGLAASRFFAIQTRKLAPISQWPQEVASRNSHEMCGKSVTGRRLIVLMETVEVAWICTLIKTASLPPIPL